MTTKINYLNNKDMLSEIHKSKSSYCSFTKPEYHQYDIILPSLDKINIRTIAEAKKNRAKRLAEIEFSIRKANGEKLKFINSVGKKNGEYNIYRNICNYILRELKMKILNIY